MKQAYEVPEIDIQIFAADDVIVTSGLTNGNETNWEDLEQGWGSSSQ